MTHDAFFDRVCSLVSFDSRDILILEEAKNISRLIYYPVSLKHFIPFFIYFLFRPFYFVRILSESNSPFWGVTFFLINFTFGLSFFLFKTYLETPKVEVLIQTASEVIFFYPAAIIGFICLAFVVYLLSIILGGKGSFSQSLSVMGLSSFALMVAFTSLIAPLAFFGWMFYLIISYQKIHHFKFNMAFLSITIPFLIMGALALATGLLNLSPLMTTMASLIK